MGKPETYGDGHYWYMLASNRYMRARMEKLGWEYTGHRKWHLRKGKRVFSYFMRIQENLYLRQGTKPDAIWTFDDYTPRLVNDTLDKGE